MIEIITSNTQLPTVYMRAYSGVATEEEAKKIVGEGKAYWWKEQKLLYVEVTNVQQTNFGR